MYFSKKYFIKRNKINAALSIKYNLKGKSKENNLLN